MVWENLHSSGMLRIMHVEIPIFIVTPLSHTVCGLNRVFYPEKSYEIYQLKCLKYELSFEYNNSCLYHLIVHTLKFRFIVSKFL